MCSSVRKGLADSCETDKQEAAQRNRCTVMVAVVVGAASSSNFQQPPYTFCKLSNCRKPIYGAFDVDKAQNTFRELYSNKLRVE